MISNNKKFTFAVAIAVAASAPMMALATNGMNSEGFGPKDRGMGGAGVAMATETQSIVNNPAAVTAVGNRQDIAFGLFSPNDRGFDLSGTGGGFLDQTQTSKKNMFPIPYYGYSKQMGDGSAWAFTVSALGGMNTDYATNFGAGLIAVPPASGGCPTCIGRTGINLSQMFFGGTYGAKLANGVSWGVTVSLDYQQFEAEGLQMFDNAAVSSSPGNVTNNGTDTSTGIGLKVGLRGDLANGGTWGASYRLKSDMSEFDDYAGLMANQGELDIAPTLTLGVALPIGADTTLAMDYSHIDYEAVDTISNPTSIYIGPPPGPFDPATRFGTSGGPGFGWNNISVIKVGIEKQTSPDMTWRGGINIGESPLDENEFSTAFLVPGTITKSVTAGFTKQLDSNTELTAVYVRSLNNCQTGDFSASFGGGTLEACMEQNFIEVSYGMLF